MTFEVRNVSVKGRLELPRDIHANLAIANPLDKICIHCRFALVEFEDMEIDYD